MFIFMYRNFGICMQLPNSLLMLHFRDQASLISNLKGLLLTKFV